MEAHSWISVSRDGLGGVLPGPGPILLSVVMVGAVELAL